MLRTVPWAPSLFKYASHSMVVLTYKCHYMKCGTVYEITVEHFAHAS